MYDQYTDFLATSTANSVYIMIGMGASLLTIIAMWRVFAKAGEPGWAALIPFYNVYVLFKITWGSGWKFLLLLIPIANIVILIMTQLKLAKAFGKSTAFGIGLLFLGFIFMLILAFDRSQYQGVAKAESTVGEG